MPRMLCLTVFLLCLLTIPSSANLGETVAQCVTRYGAPVGFSEANPKFPFGTVAYSAGAYTLVVFLMKNVEVGARVSKHDKSAFTDAEIKTILDADSATGPWTPTASEDPACLKWDRSDLATVLYDRDKHVLIFTSEDMARVFRALPKPASTAPTTPAPAPAVAPSP